MHLDISLALTVSKEFVSNTCKDDAAAYVLSKDNTAAIFADSSVASLPQKFMAAAKGKAASPLFSTHRDLLISNCISDSYFELATHDDKSKTVTIEASILQNFFTTAKTPGAAVG
jgi:hypothetical protein